MRVTVIHNPAAGAEELDRKRLLALVEGAGHRPGYHSTRNKGWKRALDDPGELVIAAGGDGTVSKVARRLAGRGVPLAILPLGTANNIAASLGITGKPEALVSGWGGARPVPMDLALATGPWGEECIVEAIGVGVIPRLFDESPSRVPKLTTPVEEQIARNIELLLEILHRSTPWRLEVELDGRDLSGEHLLLEVMNIRSIGPRLDLAPEADPGDGLLDVIMVGEEDREAFARFLRRRLGDTCDEARLTHARGKRLRIRGAPGFVHLDDKTWQDGEDESSFDIEVEILEGAVTVLR